ncbi:MAG: lipocalin-like domain-containing protein [Pseudomonadota bacterium]
MTKPTAFDKTAFHGTWRLLSMQTRFANGKTITPYGEAPIGFITYTGQGHMHAILMPAKREAIGLPIEEFSQRSKALQVLHLLMNPGIIGRTMTAALRSMAYSGSWEVRGDTVVHHVQVATLPEWTGTVLVRSFNFEGNCLRLTANYDSGDVIDLLWERI